MGADDFDLASHTELSESGFRRRHGVPIALGTHDHTHDWISHVPRVPCGKVLAAFEAEVAS